MKHAVDKILTIVKSLMKLTNTHYDIHYVNTNDKHKQITSDNTIFICYKFFDVYPIIKQFDEIIYILQDIRLISQNTKDMLNLLELDQCCSLFASYTISYDKMKYIDIFNVCKLMNLYLPYEDIQKYINLTHMKYTDSIEIKNDIINDFLNTHGFTEQYDKTVFTLS